MAWILSSIAMLLILLSYLSAGLTQASTGSQVVLNPESRLIPVGAEALFSCKFQNVIKPHWEINGTKANNDFNKVHLRDQGFFIDPEQIYSDGIVVLTVRVNGSYPRLHNSRIQCKTFTAGINSEIATLLTIDESPLSSNPILEQPNATSLHIMWSPPFLWPGYLIKSYNITVQSNSDENINIYQINSTSFSNAVVTFPFSPWQQPCTNFTFGITPMHNQLTNQTYYATGGYLSALGLFNISAITYFRADGTPLVRAVVKPSHEICSYQELSIAINITDKASNALVTNNGPIPHRGNGSFEYDITSSNLKREVEYLMTVTVYTGFESSTRSYSFNTSLDPDLYPTNPSCIHITGESRNGQNTQLFTYKVAMGACLGLAALMLLTLGIVFICFLIHRQRRIQGKTLNVSTNRMQNAMVHNPIYDGPVYESVQPHFDTLIATVKQDLSLSNTSASNSPPRSSTPPNTGSGNNSQRMVRYLDQPIQLRSQSLSHPSTPDNNNPRSTSTVCAQAARVTGLKKNGKERNKLHLTLTLNGSESGNSTSGAPQCGKDEDVVLAGNLPGNPQGGNKKRAVVSDGDENYTVMSPIKRKDSGNIGGVIELSPEDTIKYKEEVN